jgi:DNA-binding NarL/FixJ family response regulator
MDLARLKATVTSRGLKNVIRIFNATTLSEAFHRLDEQLIDLIVTDLNLPDSNEEKTVRAIKSHFERMPLLVWTGSDSTGTVVESFRAGAEGYFLKNKSSSPNELIDTAQRMMI